MRRPREAEPVFPSAATGASLAKKGNGGNRTRHRRFPAKTLKNVRGRFWWRQPARTVLYAVVRDSLAALLAEAREVRGGLPQDMLMTSQMTGRWHSTAFTSVQWMM